MTRNKTFFEQLQEALNACKRINLHDLMESLHTFLNFSSYSRIMKENEKINKVEISLLEIKTSVDF